MDRAEFERVWQRVTGETPPLQSGAAALRELIDAGRCVLEDYALLVKRHAHWAEGLRQEKRREVRELQGEYFLLTGKRRDGEAEKRVGEIGTLQLLRRAALAEAETARRCGALAEKAEHREKAVYSALAAGADRRCEALKRAIIRSMN